MAGRIASAKDVEKCGQCSKVVSEKDNGLQCEFGDVWTHAACEGITEEVYKVLSRCEGAHWFCKKCNIGAMKMLKAVGKLDERIGRLEEDMKTKQKETESEITKVQQVIAKLEDSMERMKKLEVKQEACDQEIKAIQAKYNAVSKQMDKMNATFEELDDSLQKTVEKQNTNFRDIMKEQMEQEMMNVSETVKKEVSVSLGKVTANIQQVQTDIQETRFEAAEEREKETRRKNIILYKVPESNAERNEDRNKQDVNFCLNVFNNCMQVGIAEEDFVNVFRLGKRPEPGVSTAVRPLMVQLASYNLKNVTMESVYKLKNSEDRFKSIVIAHD